MFKTCLLLNTYHLAGIPQVLPPSCPLSSTLDYSLVLLLFVSLGLFLLLTAALAKKTVIEKTEGIFILNEKNYDKAVKEFDHLLVYFYAPW